MKPFKPKEVYSKRKSAAFYSKPDSARFNNLQSDSHDLDDLSDVLGHDTDVTNVTGYDIMWIYTIVGEIPVKMKLDTGSKVSLIPVKIFIELFSTVRR